jgi:hypothetical protein
VFAYIAGSAATGGNAMVQEKKYISMGENYNYIQFIWYKGVKYYNSDYAGSDEDEITLLEL